MEFSCHFSEPIQYCVSALAEHMLYYKTYQPVWVKSQSVCAIITQPQDNFWLQSVVRPPPLSKKKCGKLSKGT